MPQRHPLLYDVERWRQWRFRLLGLAVLCLVPAALSGVQKVDPTILQLYSLFAAFLCSLALMFYLRKRGSYVQVEGEELVVKIAVSGRQRIPLSELRRPRMVKLRAVFDRPELSRIRPRPWHKWEDREALSLRIDSDAVDLVKLRRLLGPKCVLGREVVVPVVDGQRLLREMGRFEEPERATPGAGASRGAARRRKRG